MSLANNNNWPITVAYEPVQVIIGQDNTGYPSSGRDNNVMQLFIKSFDSVTVKLEVDGCTSVAQLKSLVNERTGVPENEQRLIHAGQHLADDRCLGDSGVMDNSTVWMLLRLRGGNMSIFVKVLGGKNVKLDVPSKEATVAYLQTKLREEEGLEVGKYDLMFCGQKLDPTKQLGDYQIESDATLDAVLPTIVPKNRCSVSGCIDRIAKIIGECRYCGHGYCSRHRLPESHSCDNMQGCRQQSYEKNSSKLMGEKCVADKV